jgi:hypothetical protein
MYRTSGSLKPWLKVFEAEDKLDVLKLTAELGVGVLGIC